MRTPEGASSTVLLLSMSAMADMLSLTQLPLAATIGRDQSEELDVCLLSLYRGRPVKRQSPWATNGGYQPKAGRRGSHP